MPCPQLRYFLLTVGVTSTLLLGATPASAGARNLPVAPPDPAEYAAPAIQIQTPPRPKASAKIRSSALETAPLSLKTSNGLTSPDLGAAACASDPLRPANPNGLTAASQLARLNATATGAIQPENRQLSAARQQRLQANAAWQMGLLTLHGICVVLNTADAEAWFERAQRLGEPLAPAGLAWCEIEGCKAAANPAAAGKWIELLRRVDAPRALYLQWLMQSRLAPMELAPSNLGSTSKRVTALQNRQLLINAAQQGDTNARIELGLDSVFANDLAEATAFFKSAAAKSAAATINSAVVAERLKSVVKPQPINRTSNNTTTVNIKPLSTSDNLAQAQRYHRGTGVPSNYTEAIRLYQLAKNQGDQTAKKMLELIFSRPGIDGQIDLAWMQQLAQVDLSSASPSIDSNNSKQNLKREPSPLFELVPPQWRQFAASAVSA